MNAMTMSPNAPVAIDLSAAGWSWTHVASRVAAAVRAAQARHEARRAYAYMLGCDDHLLRDMGVTRRDVHAAMQALDGRRP
jgi:uncharacterized protein YjiS (DUF1127 family)